MTKILILSLIVFCLVSCKKRFHYVAKVYQENSSFGDVMTDNAIEAENDFQGYVNGYAYYYTCKRVDTDMKNGRVTGFDVYDQNGVNLKYKLTQHEIDSAQRMFSSLGK